MSATVSGPAKLDIAAVVSPISRVAKATACAVVLLKKSRRLNGVSCVGVGSGVFTIGSGTGVGGVGSIGSGVMIMIGSESICIQELLLSVASGL